VTQLHPETQPDGGVGTLQEQFLQHFDHHDKRLGGVRTEVFRALRDVPIRWSDSYGGFWLVSGYDEARYVMQHSDLFSTAPSVNIPAGLGQKQPMLPLEVDPPDHVKYRALLAPAFSPQRMRLMTAQIEELAGELLDRVVGLGRADFFDQFADPLPVRIFVRIMGLPAEDIPRFTRWKNVLLHGHADDPDGTVRAAASDELNDYLLALIRARRAAPGEDLLSAIVHADVDGERLTDDELLGMTFLLFVAGLDTVSSSIALQLLFLATHPRHSAELVANLHDPRFLDSAVEELLRFNSLILLARTATRDAELFGVGVKAGDRVLVNTISANLDPREFAQPDDVDLRREPNRNVAFGAGPHRCPGSHLARIELAIVHRLVHERIPEYSLDPDADIHFHFGSVAGLDSLPLVWTS
jgi:cytochrome P450